MFRIIAISLVLLYATCPALAWEPLTSAKKETLYATNMEEEAYLAMTEELVGLRLTRQEVFAGVEDNKISSPIRLLTDDVDCPTDYETASDLLDSDPEKLDPICYRDYWQIAHYPQKIGSPQIDQAIKDWLKQSIDEYGGYNSFLVTYRVWRPSERYISIAFRFHIYPGGAHDDWQWTVLNFDLASGRALTLEDIFPDMGYFAPLLELYIAQQFVPDRLEYLAQRRANGLWEEGEDDHLLFYPLDMKVERLVLAEDGLQVIYSVYEQGAFVDGDKIAKIPLADIPKLGGATAFWQQ